jgi:hypothetical protein
MSGYAVAWIVTILVIALLGEATRRAGEGSGGRVVAWFVLFVGIAFVGGMVGGLMASAW